MTIFQISDFFFVKFLTLLNYFFNFLNTKGQFNRSVKNNFLCFYEKKKLKPKIIFGSFIKFFLKLKNIF